jgi:hypothetical protein
MKMYEEVKVQFHSFITSDGGGDCQLYVLVTLPLQKEPQVSTRKETGGKVLVYLLM